MRKKRCLISKENEPTDKAASENKRRRVDGLGNENLFEEENEFVTDADENNRRWYKDPKDIFVNFVNKAGLKISIDKDIPCRFEHLLDHPTFVRTLSDLLRKNEQYQKEFADAFERFCDNVERFVIVLMPTESDIRGVQDSLVRALLLLEPIQTQLALFLINKMSEFAQMQPVSAQRNIPKLILAQFRYLEFVVDCRKLSRKIFELIDCFGAFKDDIIRCLPELIDDETDQQRAAECLNSILERPETSTNTKIAIFECFNHLCILQENKQKIMDTIFKQLPKITVNLLPAMVNFCLMSVIDDKDGAFEIIGRLRSQLPLKEIDRFSSFSNSEEHPLVLILQSIQTKIRFRDNTFGKAVLRSVTDLKETKPLDIFLLLVLRELQKYSKRVITEIRKLVREGNISDDSLNIAFKHTAVIEKYFKGVLEIAEMLIRSTEESSRAFGAYLYKLCFANFANIHKQQVIVALVSHVGSESNETDCALACLKEMIDDRLTEILPFETFIRNLLNYLHMLNYEQVKTLFQILSSLAQSSADVGDSAMDEIKIVIGKNMGSSTAREKAWGVIGSLMLLKALLQIKNRTSELRKEILILLKSLVQSTKDSAKARSLFYEELGSVLSDSSDGMEALSWMCGPLCKTFCDRYLISSYDLCENDNRRVVFDLRPFDMIRNRSVINLLGSVDNDKLLCLTPLLRLVALFAKKQDGRVWDEVKKWFVLPVMCYDSNTVTWNMRESDEKTKQTCTVLFYCANWFRQLLNTLYSDEGSNVDALLLSRLRNLLDLESDLRRCLEGVSSFSIPLGGLYADEQNTYIIQQDVTVGRKTKAKKAKKPELSIYLEYDRDEHDDQPGPSTGRAPTKAPDGAKIFEPDKYGTFLQPLQSGLLYRLLKLPIDIAPEEDAVECADKLIAKDLLFLLSQLGLRLEEVLPAKQVQFAGFGKAAKCQLFETKERPLDLVNGFAEIVPNLKKLMDYCSSHFKERTEQVGGLYSLDLSNYQYWELDKCLYECLSALATMFRWIDFANRQDVQMTICSAFVEQSDGKSANALVDFVFNYLVKMSSSVPNFKCAMAVINNLQALWPVTSNSQLSMDKLAQVAHEYLKRDWADPHNPSEHRGAPFNAKLRQLLNAYMGHSNSEVHIKPIVTIGFADLLNNKQTRKSDTYKTLTKYSFACYYRIVMESLVRLVKQIPKKNDLKEKETEKAKKDRENCFQKWNEAITLFNMSLQMIRDSNQFRSITVMNATLREGRLFIESILEQTSSFFFLIDSHLDQFGDKLMKLIKVFQKSTRFLCHLCDHVKANKKLKQKTILRLLPEVRISLEKLVRRMQQSLTCAGVHSAMEIGSTSKKDLTGKDIWETDENCEIPEERDGDLLEDLEDDDGSGDESDESCDAFCF